MAGPVWLAATVPVSTKIPEPIVLPRPIAMSARAESTCFRRLLPAGAGSIGRTAHIWRSIEVFAGPLALLLVFLTSDICGSFRRRPRTQVAASLSHAEVIQHAPGPPSGPVLAFPRPAGRVSPVHFQEKSHVDGCQPRGRTAP